MKNAKILLKKLKVVIILHVSADMSFVKNANRNGKKATYVNTQC